MFDWQNESFRRKIFSSSSPRSPQREFVSIVVRAIYPHEDKKLAGNRIRRRMDTGRKKGLLPSAMEFTPEEFWPWATVQWPNLVDAMPQIELSPYVDVPAAKLAIQGISPNVQISDIPTDEVERIALIHNLLSENLRLRQTVEGLETQLEQFQTRSDIARAYGRLGGRGRTI